MLKNFLNETANLGTIEKLSKAKKAKYQGQTVTDMRNDLIERAKASIKALETHKSGPLRAPMARSIRNGITVKIGYGQRNVGFFEENEDKNAKPVAIIPARNFARGEAFVAAAYLRKVINLVNAGEFDALLSKALADMTARFSGTRADNVLQFAAE
jgi:hypothetical protein